MVGAKPPIRICTSPTHTGIACGCGSEFVQYPKYMKRHQPLGLRHLLSFSVIDRQGNLVRLLAKAPKQSAK
jgi:hypothetical protein